MQIGVQVSGLIEQFMASIHIIYHAAVQCSMNQTGRYRIYACRLSILQYRIWTTVSHNMNGIRV